MRIPFIALAVSALLISLSGCKRYEDTVTTYHFSRDVKAGELFDMNMVSSSPFTLSMDVNLPITAKDILKDEVLDAEINDYIGRPLLRDVERNDDLRYDLFADDESADGEMPKEE